MHILSRITPDMTRIFIDSAPQPLMLRNSQDYMTMGHQCVAHLRQNELVFFDMLQYIEGPYYVEFLEKRNVPGIHLHEIDSG